ncbi:MAG: hypothetical protein IPJ65_07355 [Archangiaceae bacterium]|nr:hypothetical protein [Archangiaceae bacterium]
MAGLSAATKVNIDKAPAPDASTVDIFHLLAVLPEQLLANPELDFATAVREGLLVQGEEPEQLEGLLQTLAELYPQVMAAAIAHSGPFYDGEQAMQRSVAARAAFENRPIDRLQRAVLRDTLNAAIDEFRRSSRTTQVDSPAYAATIREAVDKTVAASVRSIEGLLASGRSRQLSEGVYELEGRTIDGIDYAVRAWDDGKRRLHLGIPLEGNDDDGYALPTLRVESEAQPPFLHRDQLDALAFRFTTDGWQNTQEVVAKVTIDESGRPVAEFDIPVLGGEAGMLEGLFHCTSRGDFWWHDGTSNFRGYTYAVPDRHELAGLAESLRPTGSVLDWQ